MNRPCRKLAFQFSLVTALLLLAGCQQTPPAALPAATQPATAQDERSPADQQILAKLAKPIAVDLHAMHIDAALDQLARLAGVNVDVDWSYLQTVEVTKETPVTLKLADVPAKVILERMLAQISAHLDDPVRYEVRDGIVTVSTVKGLAAVAEMHIYDIGPLLTPPIAGTIDWTHIPPFYPPNPGLASLSATSSAAPTTAPAVHSWWPALSSAYAERLQNLQELIKNTAGNPDDWYPNGNGTYYMQEFNGGLVVRAPAAMHRELRAALDELRRQMESNIAAELRHEAVIELLAKADALRHQQRYDAALNLANEALAIDPQHPWARAMKQVLTDRQARTPEAK